uniref:Lipase n=1 Tax=Stomoxys calcitrans TaxID=35570 RepID=A0A1I8QD43_STOCA
MQTLTAFVIFLLAVVVTSAGAVDTCDRIIQHGYPCGRHNLTTSDGYRLTMFRIPHSHRGDPQHNVTDKPPVLFMHCVECSSDIWILVGPDSALPFMLADAGFDVWLGNARGNMYSEEHVTMERSSIAFWAFSLDELGTIDVPAKIDYILAKSKKKSLHFVGYSQGTTNFIAALSNKPEYNDKIRSSHLLGPVVFLCHVGGPFPVLASPLVGSDNPFAHMLGTLVGTVPLHELTALARSVALALCTRPDFEEMCVGIMNIIAGWDSPYLNRSVIPELLSTFPAGCSFRQFVHYAQNVMSCDFRYFDFGLAGNMLKYGQAKPPSYNLSNVHPETPMELYFADNDNFVPARDIYHLYKIFGKRASWNRVKHTKYNHNDYAMAYNVKECLYDCILDKMQEYERRPFKGDQCTCFKKNAF